MGAATTENESSPTTKICIPDITVIDNSDYKFVPKKRKNRARKVSILICAITALLVLAFCIAKGKEIVYKLDATQCNTNATNECYIREEIQSFPALLSTALSLFGVVLGTLVDRLSLAAEERFHVQERYGGSYKKMFKACFSGISWLPVIALMLLAAVIVVILIASNPSFELRYVVYVFSGVGVGPLIMHLLNLNTQSEVHISTILEKREMYVANGLAWSYYFNYLSQALPNFTQAINNYRRQLSLKKLILLIPHDCNMRDLNQLDQKIERLPDTGNDQDPFHFPIYCLTTEDNNKKYFAIQYVKYPLRTLREMRLLEDVRAVKKETCEKEVELLCRTLFDILEDPPNQAFKGMCLLAPITAKRLENLENGGLVKCIMRVVQHSGSTQVDGAPGFIEAKESCLSKQFNEAKDRKEKKGKELREYKGETSHQTEMEALKAAENHHSSDTYEYSLDGDHSEPVTHRATVHTMGVMKKTSSSSNVVQDKGKNKKGEELRRKYKSEASNQIELQDLKTCEDHDSSEDDTYYTLNEGESEPVSQRVGVMANSANNRSYSSGMDDTAGGCVLEANEDMTGIKQEQSVL
ncbi:stimulator of interferon genes protein-like [Dendronephthya gigantea]|uniref:stimulator of interferon genes protein-like n=1 Tax=Dendronephthya gigantea TaxID=151771 RepID=UPI0010692FB7|nr:stimulator of interferon genes protein-like [Dendronephthya gigantea]